MIASSKGSPLLSSHCWEHAKMGPNSGFGIIVICPVNVWPLAYSLCVVPRTCQVSSPASLKFPPPPHTHTDAMGSPSLFTAHSSPKLYTEPPQAYLVATKKPTAVLLGCGRPKTMGSPTTPLNASPTLRFPLTSFNEL